MHTRIASIPAQAPAHAEAPATERLRAALSRDMRSGRSLKAEPVAHRMSISAGHLRRLLRAEGTSLLAVRDALLLEETLACFARGDSIETTARRLGFAETRSFRRAFKRWTGLTPSAYLRSDLRGGRR